MARAAGPKPITTSALVVADLDGARPRFLCKDARRGHPVVTLDPEKALRFDSLAAAELFLDGWRGQVKDWSPSYGDWRVWRATTRTAFAEPEV